MEASGCEPDGYFIWNSDILASPESFTAYERMDDEWSQTSNTAMNSPELSPFYAGTFDPAYQTNFAFLKSIVDNRQHLVSDGDLYVAQDVS